MVSVVSGGGAPTARETADAKARSEKDDVAADPTVRLLLDTFPGAEIVAVRSLIEPPAPVPVAAAAPDGPDADIGYADAVYAEDDYTDDDL